MTRPEPGETPRIPLSRRPLGIESFRVEGRIGTEAVHARWDGWSVWMSQTLWDYTLTAVAVDEVFIEAGIDALRPSGVKGGPEELMLVLITCCDQLDLAEYELHGNRRVMSA
jgi:hypothetical protein